MNEGLTLEKALKIIQVFRLLEMARHLQSDIAVEALRKQVEGFTITDDICPTPAETARYLDATAALEKFESHAAGITALEESLNELSRTL
ncbi:hypothetical protein D3C80_1493590 [compost metagenome]